MYTKEIKSFKDDLVEVNKFKGAIRSGIQNLFDATGAHTDDFISLAGCSSTVNNHNMANYLGALEEKLEEMIDQTEDEHDQLYNIFNLE